MSDQNRAALEQHIVSLSASNDFQKARAEWSLDRIELSEEFDHCPCGQQIKEHCFIHNRLTGQSTYVGNVCIRQFMGIDTGNLFDGLRRIRDNPRANANMAVIEYADERGYLFEKERAFLISTVRKSKPSEKVLAWKEKINIRIIRQAVVSRRGQAPKG